ncbi:MAG: SdiA-regulated domain-containing protein [Chitinophagaceae bacterium]
MNYFGNKAIIVIILSMLVLSCQSSAKEEQTIKGYDLGKPDKFIMPESLMEISGISFNKGNSDTIYAIQDEQGRLFRLAWGVKKQYNTKFSKHGDYEDVTIVNDQVFILKSNGSLFSLPLAEVEYEETDSVREWKHALPKGEYEGMYGDETTGSVYIICKNCPDDDSKELVTGYILKIGDSVQQTGTFQVDVKKIKAFTGKVKRGFRPSALAKNPITSEWYIISAVNKLLVVTDGEWVVKEASFLNGNVFNQPEGIAFDKNGNLYISNEGDDFSQGNILRFMLSK